MLALARHHGWEIRGYERAGHPVQQRIRQAIEQWTGLAPEQIMEATDGCTTVCFGIPVVAMARAYAALAAGRTESLRRVRQAMLAHPVLIAGEGRFCTEVMQAVPGALIVKVGAEGIHCAAVPGAGIGIALKVEDGENRASGPALLATLEALASRLTAEARLEPEQLRHWRRAIVRNTRDEPVGEIRAAGALQFFNAS
jgi:L-asparaginase II